MNREGLRTVGIKRILAVMLSLTLLVLAGCSGAKDSTTATPAAAKPEDKQQATKKEPIVLAGIVSLSGLNASLGTQDKTAMEVAAEQINASGGVMGHPIELIFFDEYSDPAETLKKVDEAKAFAVIGFDSSGNALKYYPQIMKQKRLLMISGAGSPDLTAAVTKDPVANKYLFRNGNHARDWARTAAVYLRDIAKAKTYLYLSQDNAFGKSLEPILADLVKEDGITPVGSAYFARGDSNFDKAFSLINEKKPDVIVSYIGPSGFAFAKAYHEKQIAIPLFDIAAGSYELEAQVKTELGPQADYISLTLFAADVPITSKTKPFFSAYKAKLNATPGGLFDVRAGDAVSIIAEAITQAGAVDTDKVISVLERKSFTGVAGIYEFDSSHQAKWGPSYLSSLIGQWQNGKLEIVWPAQNKTSDYQLAPWWKMSK